MLYSYKECLKKYSNNYQIKKAVDSGEIFFIESGLYSDKSFESALAIICKKYPKAIFTMNSAFYYYGLTDTIPDKYYLITGRGACKIRDKRVAQYFENSDMLYCGVENYEVDNCLIPIYSKERLLIELIRNKNKLPLDYYKEIINNYREILDTLNISKMQDYALLVPKSGMILQTLQMEVF